MRAFVAVLMLAGCGFDASGGAGDGEGMIDGGGRQEVDAAAERFDGAPGSPDANLPPACDSPFVKEATGCHQYIKDIAVTFDAAQADCATRGAHLVVENKEGEFAAVAAGMAPLVETDRFWIGLHDPPPDDNVFVWVTGLALADTHWAGSEPSNSGDCVNARPDGTWGDRVCTELKWFVCEKND